MSCLMSKLVTKMGPSTSLTDGWRLFGDVHAADRADDKDGGGG